MPSRWQASPGFSDEVSGAGRAPGSPPGLLGVWSSAPFLPLFCSSSLEGSVHSLMRELWSKWEEQVDEEELEAPPTVKTQLPSSPFA